MDGRISFNFLIKYDYHYEMVSDYDARDNFEQGISNLSCIKNVFRVAPQIIYDLRYGVKKVP